MNDLTFIETQFPVAKISAEAYKERKAGASQTLTSLGKWWGRKPLVLVRAALLGLLLPASDDPKKDMEIFLKLMTMDEEGLWRRKNKAIPAAVLLEILQQMPPSIRRRYAIQNPDTKTWELRPLSKEERETLQKLVFERLPYSEKLTYCLRPEQIDGPSPQAWEEINAHLGTHAHSLPELVTELGQRRFGRIPRVGDAFCGGGSIPFEAARLGCEVYASDLNPVATLLTWAALNILGGGEDVIEEVRRAQEQVFRAVDEQITEWGIEHNDLGWRADVYLYCAETRCPECGWLVPLAPSWVISEKYGVVAEWLPDEERKCYRVEIHEGVSQEHLERAERSGTVKDSRLHCPHCGIDTPMEVVRRHLRPWENDDVAPRPDDVFQERLYCIRWVETYVDADGKERTRRHYRAPTREDLRREEKVLALLKERFAAWQEKGYLPSRRIEPGDETSRLQRERGWTYWHHLFHPRQLLVLGLLASQMKKEITHLIRLGNLCDFNSKLTRYPPTRETINNTFSNQALNTILNFPVRGFSQCYEPFIFSGHQEKLGTRTSVIPTDARNVTADCDYWITDPPYADAVNYHELSEFFLAWYEKHLPRLFPGWYADSKRALAIRGSDPLEFRRSMVAAYRNLTAHMPDNGLQIVMFTHQDAAVWADLSLILWAAGLRVTTAWTVATETDVAFKQGNYVQGTVLLVCRKRTERTPLFLDELVPRIEREVKRQLESMLALDDASEPNFSDADYQLAAYAAALRVLTAQPIEDIDVEREITRVYKPGEESILERLIRDAVKIACDYLVPRGIEGHVWRSLTPPERFYLKGLEIESHGEYRNGVYQELARGFGVSDYKDLLASTVANQTRLKTPSEFGRRLLGKNGFGSSLVRHVLFALFEAERQEDPTPGLNYLKTELPDYWDRRETIIIILNYLSALQRVSGMTHWQRAAEMAELLSVRVRHDTL
jgi:adenine-specific DNA methylase